MRKVKFINNEYYHIYNRGIESRKVFLGDKDYSRFLTGMSEFNDRNPIYNLYRLFEAELQTSLIGAELQTKDKEPLVEFVCYCIMPNHFHFVLQQIYPGGISKFMQKLGTGYTNYFNKKYQRAGVLFQGAFKATHIKDDSYILHLSRYIHLNPLDIIWSGWRKEGIEDWTKAYEFLRNYKWSSLSFYIGDKNKKPSLVRLTPEIVLHQFKDIAGYEKFVSSWATKDLDLIGVVD